MSGGAEEFRDSHLTSAFSASFVAKQAENNLKKFKFPLDKQLNKWYNEYSQEGKRVASESAFHRERTAQGQPNPSKAKVNSLLTDN